MLEHQLEPKHQRTGLVLSLQGRCKFELVDYSRCIDLYQAMLTVDPARVEGLDYMSTALWHLKKEAELAWIAQKLTDSDRYVDQSYRI